MKKRSLFIAALLLAAALLALAPIVVAQHPFSFWKSGATPTPSATPPPSPATHSFTYASNGDTNGVFYFAGQSYTSGASWTNPHTAGTAVLLSNGDNTGSDLKQTIVDRAQSEYSTTTVTGGGWVRSDLGAGRSLTLDYYSYRYRNNVTTYSPTGWTLSGSNDGTTWTAIDTRSGLTSALNLWVSTSVAGQTTAYRYFRIQQSGNNNNGTTHFSIGELELYGTLTY